MSLLSYLIYELFKISSFCTDTSWEPTSPLYQSLAMSITCCANYFQTVTRRIHQCSEYGSDVRHPGINWVNCGVFVPVSIAKSVKNTPRTQELYSKQSGTFLRLTVYIENTDYKKRLSAQSEILKFSFCRTFTSHVKLLFTVKRIRKDSSETSK